MTILYFDFVLDYRKDKKVEIVSREDNPPNLHCLTKVDSTVTHKTVGSTKVFL